MIARPITRLEATSSKLVKVRDRVHIVRCGDPEKVFYFLIDLLESLVMQDAPGCLGNKPEFLRDLLDPQFHDVRFGDSLE